MRGEKKLKGENEMQRYSLINGLKGAMASLKGQRFGFAVNVVHKETVV